MKFAVEAWATEYGSPIEGELLDPTKDQIDLDVELPAAKWTPLAPPHGTVVPERVLFSDGVRRIDARVWIEGSGGNVHPGVCASYAAGVMSCDGRAQLIDAKVERGLFSAVNDAQAITCRHGEYEVRRSRGDTPQELWIAIQDRMGMVETELASRHDPDLVIVDGPLRASSPAKNTVGYVKTHHVAYLPETVSGVVARLGDGERTPLFLTLGRWSRFSWYLRLPGAAGHPWAGVVRCEVPADRETADVIALADRVTAMLPRFASTPHKDARAPQNLYPIAGLERELRRRLGDAHLLYRALRVAAAAA